MPSPSLLNSDDDTLKGVKGKIYIHPCFTTNNTTIFSLYIDIDNLGLKRVRKCGLKFVGRKGDRLLVDCHHT